MLACKGRIGHLKHTENGANTPGGKQSRHSGWIMHKFMPKAHLREGHFSAATPEARVERRALLAQQAKLRGESVSTRSPLAVLNYMDENASPAPAPRVAACQRMKPDRAAAQSKMVTEQALLDLCEHLLSDQRAQAIVLDGKAKTESNETADAGAAPGGEESWVTSSERRKKG